MHQNFAEFISNIFEPLFEITREPNKDPKLVAFLDNVVGLDIVDDESQHERKVHREVRLHSSPPLTLISDSHSSFLCLSQTHTT